jgi:hypothetical protein
VAGWASHPGIETPEMLYYDGRIAAAADTARFFSRRRFNSGYQCSTASTRGRFRGTTPKLEPCQVCLVFNLIYPLTDDQVSPWHSGPECSGKEVQKEGGAFTQLDLYLPGQGGAATVTLRLARDPLAPS